MTNILEKIIQDKKKIFNFNQKEKFFGFLRKKNKKFKFF